MGAKAPEPILQQIDATIAAIESAQIPFQVLLTAVLDLQSRIALEVEKCETVLTQIDQAQKTAVGGILVRGRPPIWSAEWWAEAQTSVPENIRRVAAAYRTDFTRYVRDPSRRALLHAGLLVVLALIFITARRRVHRWAAAGEGSSSALTVFDQPYAAALTVSLFLATSPFWQTHIPTAVKHLLQIVEVFPIILLVRPVVNPLMAPGLYALGALFAVDIVRQSFLGVPLIGQTLIVMESILGIIATGWLLMKLSRPREDVAKPARPHLFRLVVRLVLLSFAVGLATAALGYMRLARLLTPSILAGGILAMALYAYIRVVSGVVALGLAIWPLNALRMVLHKRGLIEKQMHRLFVSMALLGWLIRYLDYIGFFDPTLSLGKAVLTARLQRGSIDISVEDVLAFVLSVWAAYLLSGAIRFVFREDVYPRMKIAPGVSYAVSSLLHYVILALGFVVGIGLLGVNLTRVTVLAGAFGVGIGFGLQSVVNNFVSGLILLFERPIHVGDVVEVGDLLGMVRRIGIRSSMVHTRQGADIIVPNSQLITEKVTNWTLSDQLRRIDLPVGVNYGAIPREVIKLIEEVARATTGVLKDPAPQGLFLGYGDSSINFELRAWTDHYIDWPQIRSELAVAVYDKVYAAGMTFPFPQREVRILDNLEGTKTGTAVSPSDRRESEQT